MTRAAVLPGALCVTAILFGCAVDVGPFFTPPQYPEDQAKFNQGRLGLLTPDLTKENELIAFRLLSGLTIGDGDAKLGAPASKLADRDAFNASISGQEAWEKARKPIINPPVSGYIGTYRTSQASSSYVFYPNCLDDAFETAARTLRERQTSYTSPVAFKAWVVAQDQVFANCSSKTPAYPEAAAANEPVLVRNDREYQIAAAHFYAEDLEGAEKRFRAIAAEGQSPWQHIARYMVPRTLLREVSLQKNAGALPMARQEFQKIADDPAGGSLAESARGMVRHLDAIERPGSAMEYLSKQLLLPRPTPGVLESALGESAYVLTAGQFSNPLSDANVPEPFDWVRTLERGAIAHALDRWRSSHSLPWFTVSMMYAAGKDQAAEELIGQADHLSPGSPAFGTATYNAVRLRIERGETEEPRRQLDALLATTEGQPDSLVNGWRAERMRVATSFDDFLRWAPRKPINADEFFGKEGNADSPVLAVDAAEVLNFKVPSSKLAVAVNSKRLPPWSNSDIALATWTRAFMLKDAAIASDVAPIVAKAHPDWAQSLTPMRGTQADAWRFRAALLIALHREFQPLVPVDYRKHVDPGSWWCPIPAAGTMRTFDGREPDVAWHLPALFTPSDAVLSQAERTRAEEETDRIRKAGSAQSFLAPIIFDWAKAHPDDPLVPQALHRLVFVVRYGCRFNVPEGGQISKAAFDLLHEKYPKSEWTAKTPYWFK